MPLQRRLTVVTKPLEVSFEQAAATPLAGITALRGVRDAGRIQPGQKVLINGSAGGVGTFSVQLAKYFGAEVTAVCSTRNLDQSVALGADHVIDYTKEDFTKNGRQYDLILAVNGYHPISDYKKSLGPGGRYVMLGGSGKQMYQAMIYGPLLSVGSGKKLLSLSAGATLEDLILLSELLELGKIKAVIDKRYSLSDVPDAIRYLETGHAKGKVVILPW